VAIFPGRVIPLLRRVIFEDLPAQQSINTNLHRKIAMTFKSENETITERPIMEAIQIAASLLPHVHDL
jgi:hypothetical protein